MVGPADVIQRQFDAYNAHDLEGFLANFHDDVTSYRMPSVEPSIRGKAALREFYATQRFNRPALKAELLHRIVLGNKVFDHERITGLSEQPIEMVAVFEVVALDRGGLIQTTWFYSA
ncbi:MAG TPA: nuclear transport factor 2 family protein [Kofleriaceae bacterium]|nr:nuclear transport factor 2 family protein [Kofleriaceae bacterium]